MTRRTILSLLAGVFSRPAPGSPAATGTREELRYRADAVITLLSVPIYSRAGVGSGCAYIQTSENGSVRHTALGFAGGSWPSRAKGLNRFGCFEERIVEKDSAIREADYFGFMTASREETLREAKNALASPDEIPISAIEGWMSPHLCRTRIARLKVENTQSWSDVHTLAPRIRRSFQASGVPSQQGGPSEPALPPFLYAVTRAIRVRNKESLQVFSYAGRPYRLSCAIKPDQSAGRRFAERRLAADANSVQVLSGQISNEKSTTRFRLWFDASASIPIPLRIELQPKPYLHLVFEADPSLPDASFPDLQASG